MGYSHGEMFSSWLVTTRIDPSRLFGSVTRKCSVRPSAWIDSTSLQARLELGSLSSNLPPRFQAISLRRSIARGFDAVDERTLLLSVKPEYAQKLLRGEKTVELRRVRPCRIRPGDVVLLYATAPTALFVGYCRIVEILLDSPTALWQKVKCSAGVTRTEYFRYFQAARRAVGIVIERPIPLAEDFSLDDSRRFVPGFRPPQSFCYLSGLDPDLQDALGAAMRRAVSITGECEPQ